MSAPRRRERHDLARAAPSSSATCSRRAASAASMRDRLERDLRADRQPAERRQVGRDDGRDLGIAAGGLPVGQQHDRLAVARAPGSSPARCRRRRCRSRGCGRAAGRSSRMPMRSELGADGVLAVEEGRDLALREVVGLRARMARNARPAAARSKPSSLTSPRSLACVWRSGSRSPATSARPCQPPKPPRMSGRDAAEHRRDVEAAFDRDIEHGAAGERADPQRLAAREPEAAACRRRVGRSLPLASARISIARLGAHDRTPHVVGLDRERRARHRRPRARRRPARLPTRALAARRLTGSSAPLTGTPRC